MIMWHICAHSPMCSSWCIFSYLLLIWMSEVNPKLKADSITPFCGHFRRCNVVGGEQAPHSPLGWYYLLILVIFSPACILFCTSHTWPPQLIICLKQMISWSRAGRHPSNTTQHSVWACQGLHSTTWENSTKVGDELCQAQLSLNYLDTGAMKKRGGVFGTTKLFIRVK